MQYTKMATVGFLPLDTCTCEYLAQYML